MFFSTLIPYVLKQGASYMGLNSYILWGIIIVVPVTVYSVGMIQKETFRGFMYNRGRSISQKFKMIPYIKIIMGQVDN